MHTAFAKAILFAGIAATVVHCKPEDQQIVKSFAYDLQDNVIDMNIEFKKDIELNTEFNIPILNYGSIRLSPSNDASGFKIGGTIDLNIINDEEIVKLEKTRFLPNGQPMSDYVETDVTRLHIDVSEQVDVSVYLGMELDYLYLGTAVELSFIDAHFPAGLVISQRIRDAQGRPVGVVTLFGPKVTDGTLEAPGGLFFITNVSDLIKYGQSQSLIAGSLNAKTLLVYDGVTTINEPYTKTYSDKKNLMKLLDLYKKRGKKAGMID